MPLGKGLSVLEILWRKDEVTNEILPRATRWVNPSYYGYPANTTQDERLLLDPTGRGVIMAGSADNEFPENKFLIGAYRTMSCDRVTEGALLRKLAPWWAYTTYSVEWMLQYAQTFGQPFRLGKYDPADPDAKKVMSEMLENMGAAAWAAVTKNSTVDFLDAGKNSAENPQNHIIDMADRYADYLLLGQVLTSNSGKHGTKGLGEVHERIRADRLDQYTKFAADVINDQLIPAILRLNYGDADEAPYVSGDNSDEEDQDKLAARFKVLTVDCRLPVGKQWAYDFLGIPMPADEEELLAPVQAPPPGGSAPRSLDDPSANSDGVPNDFPMVGDAGLPADVEMILGKMPPEVRQYYAGLLIQAGHHKKCRPGHTMSQGGRCMPAGWQPKEKAGKKGKLKNQPEKPTQTQGQKLLMEGNKFDQHLAIEKPGKLKQGDWEFIIQNSEKAMSVLNLFTNHGYVDMNEVPPEEAAHILHEVLNKAPDLKDVPLHRGMKFESLGKKAEFLAKFTNADGAVMGKNFTSFSKEIGVAKKFGYGIDGQEKNLIITIKSHQDAKDISKLSKFPDEHEALFGPQAKFRIVGDISRGLDKMDHLTLEQVK